MKLEVGMYVRTNRGEIFKFVKIENGQYRRTLGSDNETMTTTFKLENVLKYSYNIIDLIEEGDYVNGLLVVEYDNKNHCFICECGGMFTGENWIYKSGDIKSIVTKEQFENVKYKIGE